MGPFKNVLQKALLFKCLFGICCSCADIPSERWICVGRFGVVREFDFYLCYFLCKKKSIGLLAEMIQMYPTSAVSCYCKDPRHWDNWICPVFCQ